MESQETQITQGSSLSFSKKLQLFTDKYFSRKTIGVAVALLIAINIPVALYFAQQRQNVKQHASTNGSVTFLNATTNQPITDETTTDPNVKLQILLPDNWTPPSPPSSRQNIIQQAYAQTTTPSVTPEATFTPVPPTPMPKPPPCGQYGDVNIDGQVTDTDATWISEAVSGSRTLTDEQKKRADVDGVSGISVGDVLKILQYLNGTLTTFPICSITPTLTTQSTPSPSVNPSPTSPSHIIKSINIFNNTSGDGDTTLTITGQDIIAALAGNPIPWKLNSLASQPGGSRAINVQFTDTDNNSVTNIATITLVAPGTTSPTPTPPVTTIDTLDYFLTKHPDQGLTGKHPLSQFVDGQRAYYMKWQKAGDPAGKSSIFEVYTWDNDNIYLKEDHSGAPVNFYTFAPGTWMKRHMAIGEKITVSSNTIQWYDPTCNAVAPNNQSFPIEITLERHDLAFPAGEDLGNQDIIVVKYDSKPNSTDGIFERFYYSKEWGWVKWEEYNKATNAVTNTSTFNKIAQNPLQPLASAACTPEFRTSVPASPTTTPVASPSATMTPNPSTTIPPTATPSGTIIPTMTLIPTPTFPPGDTIFTVKVGLQGIGNGANTTPIHPQRTFSISLFDNTETAVSTKSGMLAFNTATNIFEGQIDMGTPAPGNYTVKAKTDKYLTKVIANILTISADKKDYKFPNIPTLVAGDINNDNLLNVGDYNVYKDCLFEKDAGKILACKIITDLNDDGVTDTIIPPQSFLDYAQLIKNFSLQKGE